MKLNIAFLFLLFMTGLARAQHPAFLPNPMHGVHSFPDSISLEFQDEHAMIVFKFKSPSDAGDRIKIFFRIFPQILESVEKGTLDLSTPHHVDVQLVNAGETRIIVRDEPTKSTRIRTLGKEIVELLPPGWDFSIQSKDERIDVYGQTFEQLKAVSGYDPSPLKQTFADSLAKYANSRARMMARIIVQQGKIAYQEIKFQIPQDFLVGTLSSGLGLLGNTFYPELNAVITLQRGNHFNQRQTKLSVIYNNLFFIGRDPDGTFSAKVTSFISLAWSKSMGATGQSFGLGAGYLIYKEGGPFVGKTAKFFFTKDLGPVNISPEFYLTNKFRDVQMGIRINYTF